MVKENEGMQPIYEGLQDADAKREAQLIETINNILLHEKETGNINRKTNVKDSYALPTLDTISVYLDKKYKKDADVLCNIINTWSKAHKDISVSIGGWLISGIFDTFKGFVESIKQRSLGDKLLNKNKDGK